MEWTHVTTSAECYAVIRAAHPDRAIVEMKRIAHEALDSAPAEEVGE